MGRSDHGMNTCCQQNYARSRGVDEKLIVRGDTYSIQGTSLENSPRTGPLSSRRTSLRTARVLRQEGGECDANIE